MSLIAVLLVNVDKQFNYAHVRLSSGSSGVKTNAKGVLLEKLRRKRLDKISRLDYYWYSETYPSEIIVPTNSSQVAWLWSK